MRRVVAVVAVCVTFIAIVAFVWRAPVPRDGVETGRSGALVCSARVPEACAPSAEVRLALESMTEFCARTHQDAEVWIERGHEVVGRCGASAGAGDGEERAER